MRHEFRKLISESKCAVSIYLRPETVVVGSKDDVVARGYLGGHETRSLMNLLDTLMNI